MTATALITPAELATELGTDARTTRKFLRSITPRDEQPGKGSRWGIKGTKSNIAALRKQYAKFDEAQQAARAARAEKARRGIAPAGLFASWGGRGFAGGPIGVAVHTAPARHRGASRYRRGIAPCGSFCIPRPFAAGGSARGLLAGPVLCTACAGGSAWAPCGPSSINVD